MTEQNHNVTKLDRLDELVLLFYTVIAALMVPPLLVRIF